MFEENLRNAEKHQVINKNHLLFHPGGPSCNDFLAQSRTALPHPPEEKPMCFQAEKAVLEVDIICIFFILAGP